MKNKKMPCLDMSLKAYLKAAEENEFQVVIYGLVDMRIGVGVMGKHGVYRGKERLHRRSTLAAALSHRKEYEYWEKKRAAMRKKFGGVK